MEEDKLIESKKILTDYMLELNRDIQSAEDWVNTGADEEMYFAIQTVLNELDRLQKENEGLKENYKVLENAYITDSIPKSVIQDKIEELIEELNKEECDMRYDKYDIQEILKELLGE